jgi:hypothetical protein
METAKNERIKVVENNLGKETGKHSLVKRANVIGKALSSKAEEFEKDVLSVKSKLLDEAETDALLDRIREETER